MVGYHEEREQTAEINERRKRTIEEIVLENKCDINPFYGLKGKACPFNLSTEMCRNCWNIIRRCTGDCSVRSHAQQQPLSASGALVKKGSINNAEQRNSQVRLHASLCDRQRRLWVSLPSHLQRHLAWGAPDTQLVDVSHVLFCNVLVS